MMSAHLDHVLAMGVKYPTGPCAMKLTNHTATEYTTGCQIDQRISRSSQGRLRVADLRANTVSLEEAHLQQSRHLSVGLM